MIMFDDIWNSLKRDKKRLVLNQNKFRGKMAEDSSIVRSRFRGNEVQKTGRGSDYRERSVNPFTGQKGSWKYVEVKSSPTAPVSNLQKKTKEKKGGRYRVERGGAGFFYF